MLGCVGRGGSGGDGQAIRDEILHIMHRHHLPECKGTFMEEWHQKLHNNSTPDDIIICEAYLAFLHSGGKLDEFWRVIHENGITRETLRKSISKMQLEVVAIVACESSQYIGIK